MRKMIVLLRRESIALIVWFFVFLTICSLIGTLLTNYQFIYVKYFETYRTFQFCMVFTMVVMSIKLFDLKSKEKSWGYSFLCLLIAMGTIFFMYMKVY